MKRYKFNLEILLLIINIIYLIFIIPSSDYTLACGLFAFIGTNPQEYFSWDKFNILGFFNDKRGGDACGRVLNNLCQHGTDKLKKYEDFAQELKSPTYELVNNTILGHCRKASSGGKDNIYAQPIILRKKDINIKVIKDTHLKKAIKEANDDIIIFSGIHNGTIDNYKELAPKYGIALDDHNDTKVLLTALFYGYYDILEKYIGTAALIWHNHLFNKTYIYKGESKSWKSSTNTTEERPLYCWEVAPGNIYVSSMEDSLSFAGAIPDQIIDIETNKLFTFKNGQKITETIINRLEAVQNEYSNCSSNISGFNNRRDDSYYRNLYNHHYDDLPFHNASVQQRALNMKNVPIPNDIFLKEKIEFIREFNIKEPIRLQAEKNYTGLGTKTIKKAIFNKGRYWMQGGLMHGIYVLTPQGLVPNKYTKEITPLKPYYFLEGIMMDGITSYNAGLVIHDAFINDLKEKPENIGKLEQDFTTELTRYAKYPTVSLTQTTGEQDCLDNSTIYLEICFFSGRLYPLFSTRKYEFDNGDLKFIESAKEGLKQGIHADDDMGLSNLYIADCNVNNAHSSTHTIGHLLLNLENAINPLSPFQNLLFSQNSLVSDKEIQLLLIHYLRDFSLDLRLACSRCIHEQTAIPHNCAMCKDCNKAYQITLNEVDYDIYNT